MQTRKFTPRDGTPRTVYEVVARSVHQIAKLRYGKDLPSDNEPHGDERDTR